MNHKSVAVWLKFRRKQPNWFEFRRALPGIAIRVEMRVIIVAAVARLASLAASHPIGIGMRTDDRDTYGAPRAGYERCPFYDMGTVTGCDDATKNDNSVLAKEDYYRELKTLDIKELYNSIVDLTSTSQTCWPADGPQDGDKIPTPTYANRMGRLDGVWGS